MGMKKFAVSTILGIVFFMGFVTNAFAQQRYATHAVKEGETIYSIAKLYRVTPYAILQENPEVKVDEVQPNTVLVIPVGADYRGETTLKEEPQVEIVETPTSIEPTGFTKHRVRKRETLFSITQKYEITEEQLKRYNGELYAQPLKKGMTLQIPMYPEELEAEELEIDFETYVVQPKETRWSIAHSYGISVDSLIALNPSLQADASHLAVGQELRLPRPKGDSLEEQQVVIYESFTVPKSMGLFRVSQSYGIPVDSIMSLNPEIKEVGGLREGMVLRLPKQQPKESLVNTDNFVFYEVKPKQNIFRLTQNLNIDRDSLFLLNPQLENGLKAGMVLKIPREKSQTLEVKNALILDKFQLIDSLNVQNKPTVMVMLPFRLDRVNLQNKEKTANQVASRKDITYAMGLYTGAMVAVDSIAKLGLSVDLKVLDTELSLERLKTKLYNQPFNGVDAVFGPIGPDLLSEVALQANQNNVPVIAPFASKSTLSLSNVFFTNPNEEVLREKILDHVASIRENQAIIVIADENNQAAKDSILSRFPMARVAKMSEDGSLHLIDFQTMLSEQEENWVFVETDQPNLAASVTSILNASNATITDEETGEEITIVVKMFTTNYSSAFEAESVSRPHLSNLDFTFPSSFKTTERNFFNRAYLKKYGHEPDRYAVRGFDLMFDILLKLGYQKDLFATAPFIGETEYTGNRFNYFKDWTSGYYNRASYLMHYNDLRIQELQLP